MTQLTEQLDSIPALGRSNQCSTQLGYKTVHFVTSPFWMEPHSNEYSSQFGVLAFPSSRSTHEIQVSGKRTFYQSNRDLSRRDASTLQHKQCEVMGKLSWKGMDHYFWESLIQLPRHGPNQEIMKSELQYLPPKVSINFWKKWSRSPQCNTKIR